MLALKSALNLFENHVSHPKVPRAIWSLKKAFNEINSEDGNLLKVLGNNKDLVEVVIEEVTKTLTTGEMGD